MVSLQLVAMTAIPLSITAIVSPECTIPVLATVIFIVLCFIVSVARLLKPATINKDTTSSCQRRAGIKIVRLLNVVTFFGLLITLVFSYFTMLRYGVSSRKGVVGYIFPLLPYLPLSAISYYIKQKFFSNSKKSGCYGRTFEQCKNISHSASEKEQLVEQQWVYNIQKSQFEDTQALIDFTEHSSPPSDL